MGTETFRPAIEKPYGQETNDVREQRAWATSTAIHGIQGAAGIRAGGTLQECHAKRKTVRQGINAIMAVTSDREATEEEAMALNHGTRLISKLNNMIDDLERISESGLQSSRTNVMRNAADFRKHYGEGAWGNDGLSLQNFLRGIANMPTTEGIRNALSVGTNTSGGYAVPTILMPMILEAMVPNSALMQAGMGIVDLSEMPAKTYTTAAIDTIPTAAWRLENGAVAESDPTFRAVVAQPQSLAFLFKVSRELLADAPNMEDALRVAIGQAFAKSLDFTGLYGSGTAPEPRGIVNTSGVHQIASGTDGTVIANYSKFFEAMQAILQADGPMPNAAIMSPRTKLKLGGLVDTTGQPIMVPKMLEPLSMLHTSQVPNDVTVGSNDDCSDIFLGDFTRLELMLRESVSVQLLSNLYAANGQIGFVCHVRADFAVNYPKAFARVAGVR